MAIISGTVRKGEDPVEGAKVYILYDGEVVASAETNETGEYLCDGLDDDKKYHAVVEHSEVDGEEVTHYSARSMPGITPAEDPRLFLYKDGEGGENWDAWENATRYCYVDFGDSYITINAETWSTLVGGADASIITKQETDITPYNYIKIYCDHDNFSIVLMPSGGTWYDAITVNFTEMNGVQVADITQITGEHTIEIIVSCDDYESNTLEVYQVWLG